MNAETILMALDAIRYLVNSVVYAKRFYHTTDKVVAKAFEMKRLPK